MKRLVIILALVCLLPFAAFAKGASVEHATQGTLVIPPLVLTVPVPGLSNEPVVIEASLEGNWTGNGTIITTPSGIVNQQIQLDTFSGTVKAEYDYVEGDGSHVRGTLVLGLDAENGTVKMQMRNGDPTTLDLVAKVEVVTLTYADGTPVDWPEEVFGPMPNMIVIQNGSLILLTNTGKTSMAPSLHPRFKRSTTWGQIRARS